MKKIIATLILLHAFNASAQLGVTTIRNKDPFPIDQWFNFRRIKQKSKIFYKNEDSIADAVLNDLLEPWDLTIQDGELDEYEDLYWILNNGNGYAATVYLIRGYEAPGESIIVIIVTANQTRKT